TCGRVGSVLSHNRLVKEKPVMPHQIIALMTVRDEADVLLEALEHVAPMVDVLIIVDCGSEDESPSISELFAQRTTNTVFAGCIGPHHAAQVRRHVWKHCKQLCSSGTWWMIADADEFVWSESELRTTVTQATVAGADH